MRKALAHSLARAALCATLVVSATLGVAASAAQAQSPRDLLFATKSTCYLRNYDTAHLASHPDQLVKRISITPLASSFTQKQLILRLGFTLRGQPEALSVYAYCENTGARLSCGLEGDAGWLMIEPRTGGARVKVGREGLGLEGSSGFVTLGGGASDDAVFLLARFAKGGCD